MTETNCPTCGSKCKIVEEDCGGESRTILISRYVPLPHPDLTKLREAFANLPTDDNIIDLYTNKQIVGFFLDIKILVQAVKELLVAEAMARFFEK